MFLLFGICMKKIGEEIKKIATFDTEGNVILKNKKDVKRGKRSRAAGARFELKVRKYMEDGGWVLDKWTNNVDLDAGLLVKAKRKYNPFKKMLIIGTGFPDFIALKPLEKNHEVIGIEVKSNGWLDKSEKAKCKWLLEKGIFSKILIGKKGKKRGELVFDDFAERYLGI